MTARQASRKLGVEIEAAAAQARISADRLQRILRHGRATPALAERLARIYRCPVGWFLYGVRGGTVGPSKGPGEAHSAP